MSVRVMTWVWDHSQATGSDRLVLLAIADCADDDGSCWPSLGRLAAKSRVSLATVRRSLAALCERGELVITEHGGGRRTNSYRVVSERVQSEQAQSDTGITSEQAASSNTQSAPYIEPSINRHSARVRATRLPERWQPDPGDRVWARERNYPLSWQAEQLERFRDYWSAKSGADAAKLDWSATWRNWLRRAADTAPRGLRAVPAGRQYPEW